MKRIPVKLARANAPEYRVIEWKIHNVCNYDCSFCFPDNKDGSVRWLPLETYKEQFDKLFNISGNMPLWVQLTGGEPTLYPDLIELLTYIKSKGAYTSILSNGARTIRWWKELKESNVLDVLFITHHSEQKADHKHNAEVLNLFLDSPTETLCVVTHVIDTLDSAIESYDYLIENTGAIISLKAMIITAYDINLLYSDIQQEKIKKSTMRPGVLRPSKVSSNISENLHIWHTFLKVEYDDGSVEEMRAQLFLKNNRPTFKGWQCANGKYYIKLEGDTVLRGVCGEGKTTTINDPDLKFQDDYVTCTYDMCYCRSDLASPKYMVR